MNMQKFGNAETLITRVVAILRPPLEEFLQQVAARGAAYALERSTTIIRDLLQDSSDTKEVLTVEELYDFLGLEAPASEATIRRHMKEGQIPRGAPVGPQGSGLRWTKRSVIRWIEDRAETTQGRRRGLDDPEGRPAVALPLGKAESRG